MSHELNEREKNMNNNLEVKTREKWENLQEKDQKMMSGSARVSFRLKEKDTGTVNYRLTLKGMENEISLLNNFEFEKALQ